MERSYRIRDVVKEDFLRFPFALLANPKYTAMSLEAKFVYALLLNRLSLSQKNGWVNEDGEVYLIYTREEVSNTLNISYKKAIAAFKELMEQGLLYEQRQGRGICGGFQSGRTAGRAGRHAGKPGPGGQICRSGTSRPAETACLDV